MFNNKKTKLFDTTTVSKEKTTSASKNAFVSGALKTSAETRSENGALKYDTTGDSFVDQFGLLGGYKKPRNFVDISKDQSILFSENKILTLAFTLYIRMITRKTNVFGTMTESPQIGAELRHEGIMRMIWIHINDSKLFWNNIPLFISVGSWKDIICMLQYDLVYNGWSDRKLNWDKFGKLILAGLNSEDQVNLLKKYLPQIKTKNACKTVESQANCMIAKWICSLLYGTKENDSSSYKNYRKLKTSGTAHEWQKLISQGKHDLVNFEAIHGRALNLLVRSKYLVNQGLDKKYNEWISDDNTTDVKYTGFVHELFSNIKNSSINEKETINKQFTTLVNKAKDKELKTKLIVVRDTSSSMGSTATGTNMTCFNIAKALALYFSEFLTGAFENNFIEFNSTAKMHTWKGSTPVEKWMNDNTSYVGSTNFQSVVELFCKLKTEGVSETDFPTGILCISDSEFNPTNLNKTNVDTAKSSLKRAGFTKEYIDNFVIVLWNLQSYGRGNKFETYGEVKNVFYFSGYSAATISFLTNDIKTARELFDSAMNQEVLSLIKG